jgi:hypothetical protein
MALLGVIVETVTMGLLYTTAIKEGRTRLKETAQSQARLIEAIARFDAQYSKDYPLGAREATLSQVIDAHNKYQGFGETGEFTLSKKAGDKIVFLLSHRHFDLESPKPVPFDSKLAQPMRLALLGQSGTIIGLDYRGEKVLAAYEPVGELDLGIVAKIDLSEIRRPFIIAAFISAIIGIVVIGVGVALFFKITNPLIEKLYKTIRDLKKTSEEVKILSGFLPICASCKKVRDDKGYWNQIESYIRDHSEADFTHGICPDCVKDLYPEAYDRIIKTKINK